MGLDSWDEIVETLQGAPVSTDTELGAHMREFESLVRRDTDEIYTRRTHAHTRQLMETEAGNVQRCMRRAMDIERSASWSGLISLTDHSLCTDGGDHRVNSQADRRRPESESVVLEDITAGGRETNYSREDVQATGTSHHNAGTR
ncbi:hypothetical protein Tco_0861625 [Tanacetum coccineum]|uniref:Uncharacterized protein n=1 Tax=Tanacetum coccineum TaxID=301880 RepID=A0ABQ5BLY2_9ASTR